MTLLLLEHFVFSCVMPHELGLLFLRTIYCFKKSLQQSGIAVLNCWRDEKFCKYVEILVLKFVIYTLLSINTVSNTNIFDSIWLQEWEYIS